LVWRQPECRDFSVASCPPDSRAVPGACRQPPVPGPTSGRSRGRSITLAGTRCRPSVFSMPEHGWTPYAWRRLPSAATVTGQVALDRRRSTHPRSPARAHHRAGLGGTGPSSAPCRMTPKPGYTACSFHRSGSGLSGPGAPNKARARPTARAGYSASLPRRQDPSRIAAWPPGSPGSNPHAQHVAWAQSADGQLAGPENQRRTSAVS
jgi:hypothetical protein